MSTTFWSFHSLILQIKNHATPSAGQLEIFPGQKLAAHAHSKLNSPSKAKKKRRKQKNLNRQNKTECRQQKKENPLDKTPATTVMCSRKRLVMVLHAAKNDLQNLNYTKFDDEKGRSQDLPVQCRSMVLAELICERERENSYLQFLICECEKREKI